MVSAYTLKGSGSYGTPSGINPRGSIAPRPSNRGDSGVDDEIDRWNAEAITQDVSAAPSERRILKIRPERVGTEIDATRAYRR